MIKTIFSYILFSLLVIAGYSQVGINTIEPQGILHIDAGTKNDTSDDIVVSLSGNLGIGTTSPTAKIQIKTNGTSSIPVQGFKLIDGTQGAGKLLISDADGVAKWGNLIGSAAVLGEVGVTNTTFLSNIANSGYIAYSGMYITLNKGDYFINVSNWVKLGEEIFIDTNPATSRSFRMYLSTSATIFTPLVLNLGATSANASALKSNNYFYYPRLFSFLSFSTGDYYGSGSIPVRVTADNTTIYVWGWASVSNFLSSSTSATRSMTFYSTNPGSYGPYAQIFAIPVETNF